MKIKTFNDQSYILLIGENRKENDQIIKESEKDDIWFHLENISGPHFILQKSKGIGEIELDSKTLNEIGILFKEYKTNLPIKYNVIYCKLSNIKLTKTAGLVEIINNKSLKYITINL